MAKFLLARFGLILCAVLPGFFSNAQSMAYARQTVAHQQSVLSGNSLKSQSLKDVLLDLSRKFQVNIVFEESALQGIEIPISSKPKTGTLEKRLEELLNPNQLEYKKSGRET